MPLKHAARARAHTHTHTHAHTLERAFILRVRRLMPNTRKLPRLRWLLAERLLPSLPKLVPPPYLDIGLICCSAAEGGMMHDCVS